jgi:hypothetical protein
MHFARYSELAGRTRQGVGVPLLSSCDDGERYYVSYPPDFERSSDSTMVEEPRA